jgi:hypothetical protein
MFGHNSFLPRPPRGSFAAPGTTEDERYGRRTLSFLRSFRREDHMPSQVIFVVSLANIGIGTTLVRLTCQEMKHLIQPGKMTVPCLPGVAANVDQIGSGFRGETEGRHYWALSRSNSSINPCKEYAATPLSSPSFKACRKATSFNSCSSSRCRSARMASL